jgi:ankyrin repeat protein
MSVLITLPNDDIVITECNVNDNPDISANKHCYDTLQYDKDCYTLIKDDMHNRQYKLVLNNLGLLEKKLKFKNVESSYNNLYNTRHRPKIALNYAFIGDVDMIKLYILLKLNINIKDTAGNTPIMYHTSMNDINIVKILINAKASLNIKNKIHDTALMKASEYGFTNIAKLLLDSGCHDNRNLESENAMMKACKNGHLDVVKLLFRMKKCHNSRDKYMNTPLMIASSNGHLNIVEYLYSIGVLSSSVNNLGLTALDMATRNSHTSIVNILTHGVQTYELSRVVNDIIPTNEAIHDIQNILVSGNIINTSCSICLCDFEYGKNAKILQCGHIYHTGCISTWLRVKNQCPYCRSTVINNLGNLRAYKRTIIDNITL